MTILIDTKNEMNRSIDGMGARVNDLERDLRAAFTAEIAGLRDTALADLKASQYETRTSSHNAGKRAGDAVAAVADLRRDVDRLHHRLDGLSEDIGTILEALQAVAPARPPAAAASAEEPSLEPDGTSTADEPDPAVLPQQKQPPGQEPAPQTEPGAPQPSADSAPAGSQSSISTDTGAPRPTRTEPVSLPLKLSSSRRRAVETVMTFPARRWRPVSRAPTTRCRNRVRSPGQAESGRS
ncbi:hypothetical protein [Streptomyces sp. NPDC045470]|uniref:hypothetical protein n=1 Tax=Streptomyces sp. NPDC045470 TaxID=3155469 RepID=UPI0033DF2ADA